MAEGEESRRMSNVVSDSVNKFILPCSVCIQTNKKGEAERYCTICLDYFCSNCIKKTHGVESELAGHVLIAIGSMPPVPTKRCSEHGTKVIDMYCKTHREIGCSTCFILEHSQ